MIDLSSRRVWQQAAGDTDRNYVRLCLDWDVILNGPGGRGSWPKCEPILRERGLSERKITDLRRFCEEMEEGDVVILRMGTTDILGVGVILEEYSHREVFGDVDGWHLQHVRRVRWLWKSPGDPKRFDTYSLKFGDTTQLMDSDVVKAWLEDVEIPPDTVERPLKELPEHSSDHEIEVADVSEFLFDRGVASDSINALVDQIGELIRIARWYYRTKRPSEHETVAYLVVPLLRTIGWTPQRMAVEWKKLDLALFAGLPRSDDTVRVVVEAKKMGQSCLTALSQAKRYAGGKAQCQRLVVTDGIRYGVYVQQPSGTFRLHAYLNLTRMRSRYPIYGCAGAREALFAMAPEWDPIAEDAVGEDRKIASSDGANGG